MKKYKICVYAIAKNEEKFVRRWVESMSEADEIIVLDTGSTDRTTELLSEYEKVRVYSETVSPWRFDTARNLSLSKVPQDADYCVCTDLDEVFDKGWREKLEKALSCSPHKVSYRYTWSFNNDGSEGTVFNIEKIHSRRGFLWTHPVHEVLSYYGEGKVRSVFAQGIQLKHYPDSTKSRGQYLPLLELSVKEAPEDDRNMHYLGREYMFYKEYQKAIDTLKKHLSMQNARWADERCASMRYIARCLEALDNPEEAFLWLLRACTEASHLREPFMETAEFLYRHQSYHGVIFFISKALEITVHPDTYITENSYYREKPYDYLSMAYYYTGDIKKAASSAEKALQYTPDNERIRSNLTFFRNSLH